MQVKQNYAMLFDSTSCIGCEACTAVCKMRYNVPWGIFRTKISRTETGTYPDSKTSHYKVACQHCKDAACIKACPSGAIRRISDVAVVLDRDMCIGCGYCSMACPYGVAKFDRARGKAADKCSFCFKIIPEKKPFCADICPVRALSFGLRSDIIVRAEERIAHLKTLGHSKAGIYGVNELGGLGVISVLTGAPPEYGLPDNPRIPWLHRSWSNIFRPAGGIGAIAAVAVILANWISTFRQRRSDSSEEEE